MADRDTVLGGDRKEFPTTLWSQLAEAGDADRAVRRSAWERLALRYWKPVYAHVRSRWAKSNEDAKDLTQDFFAWMMETELPLRADPQRGRFRIFIRTALENYLRSDHRRRTRQKRGGAEPTHPLDFSGSEEPADACSRSPSRSLEDAWREELLTGAMETLRRGYEQENKTTYLHVFRDYYLAGAEEVRHEDLASRYGISVTDVNNYLRHAKHRFREILLGRLAETVRGPDELRREYEELFGKDPS